jgi:hypothetical protein
MDRVPVPVAGGPEFGITVFPMSDTDLTALVSDFCAAKWEGVHRGELQESAERAQVSAEIDRAIRNMSGLTRKRTTVDGRPIYFDPVVDLIRECSDEEEFRARVVGALNLAARTTAEIWYESGTREHPAAWLRETFSAVNGGRLADVPLPKSISLTVPGFGKSFGEFEITIIDTKGVEDVAVREDLDLRLKDPRTTVVLCCGFREAPGTTAKALLQHMKQTFAERFDTGKVSVLALPRGGEALQVNDDLGEPVQTVEEGYEFRRMQVAGDLGADGTRVSRGGMGAFGARQRLLSEVARRI